MPQIRRRGQPCALQRDLHILPIRLRSRIFELVRLREDAQPLTSLDPPDRRLLRVKPAEPEPRLIGKLRLAGDAEAHAPRRSVEVAGWHWPLVRQTNHRILGEVRIGFGPAALNPDSTNEHGKAPAGEVDASGFIIDGHHIWNDQTIPL